MLTVKREEGWLSYGQAGRTISFFYSLFDFSFQSHFLYFFHFFFLPCCVFFPMSSSLVITKSLLILFTFISHNLHPLPSYSCSSFPFCSSASFICPDPVLPSLSLLSFTIPFPPYLSSSFFSLSLYSFLTCSSSSFDFSVPALPSIS